MLGLLVLLGLFLAVGLTAKSIPEDAPPFFDLEAVRALARSGEGPLPKELRAQRVASGELPARVLAVAGGGFGPVTFEFFTYQLVWEDGRTAVLDAVADEKTFAENLPVKEFDAAAWARMQEAMRKADVVAVTHEHFDHASGIAHSPYLAELAPHVALTEAQLVGHHAERAGFTPEVCAHFTPLRYQGLHRLRPGVVLIAAPGHTPGSQLVYVQLAGGQEFLLVGDVAWQRENIEQPVMHPRLANWLGQEDADAMARELRELHTLLRTAPQVHQVVAHDGGQMADLMRRGLVQEGLR
ncbi:MULTISPECIES: MBL fold metallo-hydrolase [Myxococcaceae]|uniref:MBL fold metallo-hydrolase n=1 Tax=Myxococcaceae TaxID=31 RepID=UPI0018900508|nr:MBL fold metallo-hydrolase [Simulacricoccus sp. 17bor-14]